MYFAAGRSSIHGTIDHTAVLKGQIPFLAVLEAHEKCIIFYGRHLGIDYMHILNNGRSAAGQDINTKDHTVVTVRSGNIGTLKGNIPDLIAGK